MVKARLTLVHKENQGENTMHTFQAQYGDGTGHEAYAKATPYAELKMAITKGTPADGAFEVGRVYDVLFSPSDMGQNLSREDSIQAGASDY